MNDQQMQSLLDAWFEDTDPAPPDTKWAAVEVMAQVPRTRQRGRLLPFPVLHRKAQAATATDTTDYRPSPVPATNGHAPTVIGRTRTMFSPVKAITAGALVFTIGGALLIAQPLGQQEGVVPGAEEPTRLEGTRVAVAQECPYVDFDSPMVCTWTSSDPRLTGTFTHEFVGDIISVAGSDGDFSWLDATLEGADGSWAGRLYISFTDPPVGLAFLSGSGAYEGWQYVASEVGGDGHHDDWSGIIYEGELPPLGPPSVPASE